MGPICCCCGVVWCGRGPTLLWSYGAYFLLVVWCGVVWGPTLLWPYGAYFLLVWCGGGPTLLWPIFLAPLWSVFSVGGVVWRRAYIVVALWGLFSVGGVVWRKAYIVVALWGVYSVGGVVVWCGGGPSLLWAYGAYLAKTPEGLNGLKRSLEWIEILQHSKGMTRTYIGFPTNLFRETAGIGKS